MGRINQYPECTTPNNNDWLLIETEEGTKKVKKSTLLKAVVDLLGDKDISNIGNGPVTGAITNINDKLGPISSASAVSGNNAFAKINNLGNNLNKHEIGSPTQLSNNTLFTCPSDGYLRLYAIYDGSVSNFIEGFIQGSSSSDVVVISAQSTTAHGSQVAIFVKKGMKIKATPITSGKTIAQFYPIA